MTKAPTIGVVAPERNEEVRELERAGLSSMWVGGHIASKSWTPEPLAWLARLVAQTERVAVGTATLVLPLYPPALIAKQIADLDVASDGRVVLGVGVGGEVPDDFAAVGVPLAGRGRRADEAIDEIRGHWRRAAEVRAGTISSAAAPVLGPPPIQRDGPPIIVSGRSDVAIRRAALRGDGWMPYLVRPERLRQSLSALDAIAEDAGRDLRDFAVVDFVMVAVDDNAARAHNGAASFVRDAFGERTDRDPAQLVGEVVLAGTTEQVVDGLATHFAAGATEIILCPIHGDRSETAAELNRRLRPEAASWDATDPLPRMGEPT